MTPQNAGWVDHFPGLSGLNTQTRLALAQGSTLVDVPAGTCIFGPGKSPENMLLLIKGAVRVQQVSDTGREMVLYRIQAGQSCVLTTACLMAYQDYTAEGIAEADVQAAAIPRRLFDDLVAQSAEFRTFIFAAFSKRITDLFLVVDEVAFQRVDVRLAHKLIELSAGHSHVHTTHQKLAAELGTAREVVSRQLQEFHRRGWIEQSRGVVTIVRPDALEDLARHIT